MVGNKELEKRIEALEKEVQHLKAILQYQMRNKKKWLIFIAELLIMWFLICKCLRSLEHFKFKLNLKNKSTYQLLSEINFWLLIFRVDLFLYKYINLFKWLIP